jgi:hypothetical protein
MSKLMSKHQFYVLSDVQKDSGDVSAGMGIFLNPVH